MNSDQLSGDESDRIGIERLCVFAMPPVEFVNLVADVGCRHLAIALTPTAFNPYHYPSWSLRDDATLRREMKAAMRDRGVSVSLFEGFGIKPGADVGDYAADLEILAMLDGTRINATSIDRDLPRTLDQLARLAEMAEAFGIETTTEVCAGTLSSLAIAMQAVRHVARPRFRLLIDTMHYMRFGGSPVELAAIDPGVIGYMQLSDAPLIGHHASYLDEALNERQVPGTGELPLLDLLASVPQNVILGLEVPQRSLVEAGMSSIDRVGCCVKATRQLLKQLKLSHPLAK